MGRYSKSGLFNGSNGSKQISFEQFEYLMKIDKANKLKKDTKKNKNKLPIFGPNGEVTLKSISDRREFFLGKSVAKIDNILNKHGYITKRRTSKRSTSKAKIIVILNSSKERNIQQVQVSPGSRRHGNVPYVKISTSNYGKIKIIGSDRKHYKSDGKEKAKLLFRRKKK